MSEVVGEQLEKRSEGGENIYKANEFVDDGISSPESNHTLYETSVSPDNTNIISTHMKDKSPEIVSNPEYAVDVNNNPTFDEFKLLQGKSL
jgi:hypothetical protein